jgi:signal transduction histidine kinase
MFDTYLVQRDSVHQLAIHEKMVELETVYETEKKEAKIIDLEKEKRQHYWVAGALGLIFLLAIVILFFRHRLVKNQKLLADQKVSQLKQEQQLVATQATLDGETAERSRLARDLHDGLGGMLSVVRLNLKDVKTGGYIEVGDINRFDKAIDMLDDSIKELRRVAHNMMPESLLRYGLKVSLTDFCNEIPSVGLHYYGNEKRLNSNLEILVYRSAHELVNNALRHAEAKNINLQVIQEEDRISLTVQDDGKGFDTNSTPHGMGLKSINNRVASFNGKMSIYSSPGNGTEINIEFQLNNEK